MNIFLYYISTNCRFFHQSQCIWYHEQDTGLQTQYEDESELALSIQMLPTLA